ncbi:ribonuclease domain-containing protein [Flexivirga sp. B27]
MLQRLKRIRELFIPGVFGLLVLITLVCVLASCTSSAASGGPSANGGNSAAAGAGNDAGSAATSGMPRSNHAADGLPTVAAADLPAEARDTMRLIASGGPYPYHQDGTVFQNRERLLPRESSGYYHEFTVKTPGSPDRGARRIISARDGTLYYTDDHYNSFRRIVTS